MARQSKGMVLRDILEVQINTGQIAAGSRLPTELELCKKYNVSRQTVRQAILLLREDNLVETVKGSGTYVKENLGGLSASFMSVGVVATYIDNYIFPSLIRGIEEVLCSKGYTMQLSITYNSIQNEEFQLQSLINKHPSGIMIEPAKSAVVRSNMKLYHQIQKMGIPCVMMNGRLPAIDMPMVSLDDKSSGRKVAEYLISMGHKKIGACIKGDDLAGQMRYNGYREVMSKIGTDDIDNHVIWYHTEDIDSMFDGDADAYILSKLKGCTAVFCFNDLIAMKLYKLFGRNGIRIPEDVSVVGHDNYSLSDLVTPRLTTINHPIEEVGRIAAEKLTTLIRNPGPSEDILLKSDLVIRDSVKHV